jgi:hypothetical protein
MGSFYHFFVNDQVGPIGVFVRKTVYSVGDGALLMGLDERTFAMAFVAFFMQVSGLLQLPHFFGPGYSPFYQVQTVVEKTLSAFVTPSPVKEPTKKIEEIEEEDEDRKIQPSLASKKKKKKKKTS